MVHRALTNENGFALMSTFMVVVLLASLGGASLVSSSLDLKGSSNYKTATKALTTADSGITHAISVINTRGVLDIKQELVTNWNTTGSLGWFGSSWRTFTDDNKSKYKVWVEECSTVATSPNYCHCTTGCSNLARDYGVLYSTGAGPNDANRTVKVKIKRGIVTAPGALFLINGGPVGTWNGTSFTIDGRNHDLANNLAAGEERPGVSTRDDATTDSIVSGITSSEISNFQGLGYDSTNNVPSVLTASGPDTTQVAAMITQILASGGANVKTFNGGGTITEKDLFGNSLTGPGSSPTSPGIFHIVNPGINNSGPIKITGNPVGYGILIAEGPIEFNGTPEWHGLIISKSTIKFGGTSGITGSVWASGVEAGAGGDVTIHYSTEALSLANGIGASGVNLPTSINVVSWEETGTPTGTITYTTSY